MTHLYYGDPNEEFSLKLATTLLDSGADILEVGIPYTDPVCDGEIFQRACTRALENRITPIKIFEGIRKIRDKGYKQKIYLTSYYGPIFKIKVAKFVNDAKNAGVNGLIVPDILLEEQGELRRACDKFGLSLIQFATVYSSIERLKKICQKTGEFIYVISLPGVTGETIFPLNYSYSYTEVDAGRLIKNLKKITDKKVFVGFGIKSPRDVKKILQMGAEGAIVGSSIARIYENNIKYPEKSLTKISVFIKSLKESTIG